MELFGVALPGLSWPILSNLLWAIGFGGLIGVERSVRGRQAGVRTYAIVSLASACLVSAIAQ